MYLFTSCVITAVSRSPFRAIFTLLSASLVHPLRAILLPSVYVTSLELAPLISFLGSLLIVIILPLSYRRPYSNSLLVIIIILTYLTYLLFSLALVLIQSLFI